MFNLALMILTFGLLLLVGGIFAFIKALSVASLVTSSCFAAIFFLCGYFMLKGKLTALYLATFSTTALHLFFLVRFLKSYKFMPAGLMVILTTLIGSICFSYLTRKVKEKVYD